MVRVVVEDPHAARGATELESAGRAPEGLDAPHGGLEGHARPDGGQDHGGGVQRVVPAGHLQVQGALRAARHPERGALAHSGLARLHREVGDQQVRRHAVTGRRAVGHDVGGRVLPCPGGQVRRAGVVEAGHEDPALGGGRQPAREVPEDLVHRLLGPVVVQVVGLHGRDDPDRARVVHQGAVGLVGLRDEPLAPARPGVGAEPGDGGADRERGVPAGVGEGHGGHGGRGGLPVRAGDGQHPVAAHGQGEALGTVQHAQSACHGGVVLRVARPGDRGGDHRGDVPAEVRGVVADRDPGAARGELAHHGQVLRVGAGHRDALLLEDAGDPRHAHAADPQQVHAAQVGEAALGRGTGALVSAHRRAPSWAAERTRPAMVTSASRTPKRAAASPMRARRSGSVASGIS